MLKVGENAPLDVQVINERGEAISLRQFLGKYVVLYFYPKDDTPGCTQEACSFRDNTAEMLELNAIVIGISKDNLKSHTKFSDKHKLNYPLWSDPEHKLMEAFGTWQERSFIGQKYMGTTRSTFIINPEGKIAHVWEEVEPINHAQDVLLKLKELQ